MRARGIAAALAALSSGCSLILADLAPGDCASFDECEPLNERDGLDALSCELWTCDLVDRVCVRRAVDRDGDRSFGPHPAGQTCAYEPTDCDDRNPERGPDRPEACDGLDNDCDLVVDEVFAAGASPGPVEERAAIGPVEPGGGAIDVGFPASQQPAARTAVAGARSGSDREGAAIDLAAGTTEPLRWETFCGGGDPQAGCAGAPMSCAVLLTCDFGEPAVDRAGAATWIATASATTDCPTGDVRVGVHVGGGAVQVNSNAEGPGFPSCAEGPAHAPTLAALDEDTALLAYLGEPSEARACGVGSAPVGAQVLALGAMPRPGDVRRTGTVDLGATAGVAPVAVHAVPPAGWVVAFGGTDGVELRWVGADLGVTALPTLGAGVVGEVRLSGATVDGRARLGVIWSACASGPIRFQSVSIALGDPGDAVLGAEEELTSDGRAPALVWVDEGLVAPGYRREMFIATEADTGGWIAGWAPPSGGVVLERIAADGRSLGVEAPTSFDGVVEALWLARSDGARPVEAFAVDDARRVHTAGVFCAAP